MYSLLLGFVLLWTFCTSTSTRRPQSHGTGSKEEEEEITSLSQHEIPRLLVQYGIQRSGSTLQYQTLKAIMALIMYQYNIKSSEFVSGIFMKGSAEKYQKATYRLAKHHDQPFMSLYPGENATVFTTSPYEGAKVFVSPERLAATGVSSVTWEYQEAFSLKSKAMTYLEEYLRLWDILRECCGVQMSKHNRKRLKNEHDSFPPHSLWVPHCDIYNTDEILKLVKLTFVVQHVDKYSDLYWSLVLPSEVENSKLPDYCSRYDSFVRETKAEFDEIMPDNWVGKMKEPFHLIEDYFYQGKFCAGNMSDYVYIYKNEILRHISYDKFVNMETTSFTRVHLIPCQRLLKESFGEDY